MKSGTCDICQVTGTPNPSLFMHQRKTSHVGTRGPQRNFATIAIINGTLQLFQSDRPYARAVWRSWSAPPTYILVTLEAAKTQIRQSELDADACAAVKLVVDGCRVKGERLEAILKEVAGQPYASCISTTMWRPGKEKDAADLGKGILENVLLLAANDVAQPASGGKDGTEEIMGAIQALSEMPQPPSDSGDQLNNIGDVMMNINKGTGPLYNARCMTFGSPLE
ncbi:hypothetical protein N657DRAFT_630888 [Parathielavia appendiculata]|uniref:NACHT-NTPase and P-loop NTPases N-terminal domain-containing protein n=1 Tax=Parathielavia appendiculata TaxID=2587402 RepID=A0AAN6U6L9_9PEZI|nr:hypothetical protein N657DRAFT_630888 [Parathielavia appendiculata]